MAAADDLEEGAERAAKRRRIIQTAAEMVAVRAVVVLASKKPGAPDDRKTLVALSRKTVSTVRDERMRDLQALAEFHNNKSGRAGGSAETRAGAPYWKPVAYVGPVTRGATKLKAEIASLYAKCRSPKADNLDENDPDVDRVRAILSTGASSSSVEIMRQCAAAVAVTHGIDYTASLSD